MSDSRCENIEVCLFPDMGSVGFETFTVPKRKDLEGFGVFCLHLYDVRVKVVYRGVLASHVGVVFVSVNGVSTESHLSHLLSS